MPFSLATFSGVFRMRIGAVIPIRVGHLAVRVDCSHLYALSLLLIFVTTIALGLCRS